MSEGLKELSDVGVERRDLRRDLGEGDKEHAFRSLFDSAPAAIFVEDLEGRILDVNPAGCRLHRMSRDELLGRDVSELAPPGDREEVARDIQMLRNGETDRIESARYTVAGERVPVSISASHLQFSGKSALLLHVSDLTNHLLLEEQLRRSQKMEAIGRLTGGIAHDFNNLLTAILGYTELAIGMVRPEAPLYEDLERIKAAGEDASKLIRQLQAYSRQQVLEPTILDLNEVVGNMAKLGRRTIGEDVKLETRLADGLERVKLDQGQLEQVILNLLVNARDALPGGGEVVLETRAEELDEDLVTSEVMVPAGRYVSLAVTDNGCGMSSDVRERAFDPFFTTKAPDQGTGLGLSTVYGIVKQSGGFIWVESEPGRGTTVKILVPVSAQESEAPPRVRRSPAEQPTVLLTEDNEVVRELSKTVLEEAGYRVLTAESAEVALPLWSENRESIDLLLTDLVLTGLDGLSMTRSILGQRPETRALLMTGHSSEARLNPDALIEGVSVLRKPFTPARLEEAVARALA